MVDLVTFGEAMFRFSPPGHERLETATELEFRIAGAESNVAVNASRLGADAGWLSKLPDSALGRRITTTLQAHGVDPLVAWSDEGRQGTYYVEPGDAPRGINVIYDRSDAAVTTATPAELDTDAIAASEVFFTTGITPALSETLRETTAALLDRAREAGTKTAFDVNYRSKLWSHGEAGAALRELFPSIDVLVTAERDARALFDRSGAAAEIATGMADDWGFETVIVTRGEEGSVAWHDGALVEQGVFPAETHDPVGTGDALVGGFLARRLRGDSVADALEYGSATAALKRTIPGDLAVVTPEEVERVIEEGGEGISR